MWWLPFGGLLAAVAVLGLRYGGQAAALTETDVINTYAARYVAAQGEGARLTDCVARPGQGEVWLVVSCTAPGGTPIYDYHVNRFGALIDPPAPPRPQA
ncbi:MAG: hypothetical protein AAGF60_07340 [Pseudomonadota bacterium]